MATPIKKTKTKKVEQTEVTFVKVVRYTQTLTKKDFMREYDTYERADGTRLTAEEKEVLWKRLCERSACGEIEFDDVYEEEDESGDWTEDTMNDVIQEEIDEMAQEKKAE